MPYPKKYVGRYSNLVDFLSAQGFAVYPMEMVCQEVVHEKNYLVDVVGKKGNCIWAFEYKSRNDSVKRAVLQVENYRKCFDYVVVVAEKIRDLFKFRDTFKKLGVGVWHIKNGKVTVLDEPTLQPPTPLSESAIYHTQCKTIRDVMMDKFMINTGRKKKRSQTYAQIRDFYEGIKQSQLIEFFKG
ncbi:hypothetical protein ES703_45159 [subsurface metagenome]